MQINASTANNMSSLCTRVTRAEKNLGHSISSSSSNISAMQNPFEKLSVLCQRIKKLEKELGITGSTTHSNSVGQYGPSGNAVLSNKVNTLCSRVARIEKQIPTN